MSPEQDGKVFDLADGFAYNQQIEQFIRDWQGIPGEKYSISTSTLPPGLNPEEAELASLEMKSIPEVFYTQTQLPVIRPSNVRFFLEKMSKYSGSIALWSWCAGSSRLTLNMMSLPFRRFVLFPVDLRYGWDIRLPSHQVLLQEVDALFLPRVTSFEPRCKYWSRCSQAVTGRQQDQKLLHFIASHICHLHDEQRGWIVEQPRDTTIFKSSPLAILDDLEYPSPPKSDCQRRTNFCAFSPDLSLIHI